MNLFEDDKMLTIRGQGIGDGICAGYLKYRGVDLLGEAEESREGSCEDEWRRYEAARARSKAEIASIEDELYNMCGAECAHIFATQLLLADDGIFTDIPKMYINMGRTAEQAVLLAKDYFFDSLCCGKHREELICLSPDVCDVAARIFRGLTGGVFASAEEDMYLWIADMPMPSEIILRRGEIRGIVAKKGFETTSSALVARALDIPALAVDADIFFEQPKRYAILDAKESELCINPDIAVIERFSRRVSEVAEEQRDDGRDAQEIMALGNGAPIELFVNALSAGDSPCLQEIFLSEKERVDGVLVCRQRCETLDEEALFELYRTVAERMLGKLAVIRSVSPSDIVRLTESSDGGEGERELYVVKNEALRTQLSAVMRAAVYGPLSFAVSLGDDAEEISRLLFLQKELGQSLLYEGHEFSSVGICAVIDTPAAAVVCDRIIEVADLVIVDLYKLESMLSDPLGSTCGEARRRLLGNIADRSRKSQKRAIFLMRGEISQHGVGEALELGCSCFCASAQNIKALKKEIINYRSKQ